MQGGSPRLHSRVDDANMDFSRSGKRLEYPQLTVVDNPYTGPGGVLFDALNPPFGSLLRSVLLSTIRDYVPV